MSPESPLAEAEANELEHTILVRHRLEEQYHDLDQQHRTADFGMWLFLATEVMFFGTLFVALNVYRYLYPIPFERASERLNWIIGGINTVVLLVSSLFMALAVHAAQVGRRRMLLTCLSLTAALGVLFLVFKGFEYYEDYREHLIPNQTNFVTAEWIDEYGLRPDDVPRVKIFLTLYWVMTSLHGLHVLIGIAAVSVMFWLARRGLFSPEYYTPVEVTGLYWHFVDLVWIFLLPMLYLLGTHRIGS